MISNAFAFFDIGDTLARVRVSAAGNDIEEMIIFSGVLHSLEELRAEEVHLGILSNRGNIEERKVNAALERAGLLRFFEQDLILYGPKNSTALFERAAAVVRERNEENENAQPILLFVGENADERSFARKAGFLVADRPQLALEVLRQS